MLNTAKVLQLRSRFCLRFTYGAGGGTVKTTMHYARVLKNEFGLRVMPHPTCVGHTKNELLEILEDFAKEGFCNIILQGYPPKGEKTFTPIKDGLSYASELVSLIRENFPDFGIGVGGYLKSIPSRQTKIRT